MILCNDLIRLNLRFGTETGLCRWWFGVVTSDSAVGLAEQICVRKSGTQRNDYSADADGDQGADFEEFQAYGSGLCLGHFGAFEANSS